MASYDSRPLHRGVRRASTLPVRFTEAAPEVYNARSYEEDGQSSTGNIGAQQQYNYGPKMPWVAPPVPASPPPLRIPPPIGYNPQPSHRYQAGQGFDPPSPRGPPFTGSYYPPPPSPPPVRLHYQGISRKSDSRGQGSYGGFERRKRSRDKARPSRRYDSEESSDDERAGYSDYDGENPAEYSSNDSANDSDNEMTVYSFSISRGSRSLDSSETLDGSEKLKPDSNNIQKHAAPKRGKTYNVYRSEYTGMATGNTHSARLMTTPEPIKAHPPLFRWTHFEDLSMHLDDFQAGVLQTAGLTESERMGLSHLLRRVRNKFDKPLQTSKGTKARFMEPGYYADPLPREEGDRNTNPRVATWICLPYFCLEPYSNALSESRTGAHPMRTLMQARFSLARRKRDMQQAVCSAPGTPSGTCFHIAQLWCIVLDETHIFTCARNQLTSLCDELVTINNGPMPDLTKDKFLEIHVQYGEAVRWALPLEECKTWFAFMSHFWEIWPRQFWFPYKGRALTADDWPEILQLATRANSTRICMTVKLGTFFSKPNRGNLSETLMETTISNQGYGSSFAADDESSTSAREIKSNGKSKEQHGKNDRSKTEKKAVRSTKAEMLTGKFQVLSWLVLDNSDPDEQIEATLIEMDFFLCHKTNLVDRLAYKKCPKMHATAITELLMKEHIALVDGGLNVAEDESSDDSVEKRKNLSRRIDLADAASRLFRLFLPKGFTGQLGEKAWGALHRFIVQSRLSSDEADDPDVDVDNPVRRKRSRRSRSRNMSVAERNLRATKHWLVRMARRIQFIGDVLDTASPKDRLKIEIPDELVKSWLHLVMALVSSTTEHAEFNMHQTVCSNLVEEGLRKIIQSIPKKSLLSKTSLPPNEISSLLMLRLLQDVTGVNLDVTETYSEHLKSIEADLETTPLDRAHQDRIALLKQEVAVIQETLSKQRTILFSMYTAGNIKKPAMIEKSRIYDPTEHERVRTEPTAPSHVHSTFEPYYTSDFYDTPHLPLSTQLPADPTDPGGFRDLFTAEAVSLIEKRLSDFDQISMQSGYLERVNLQKIDTNKDRHEAAIYVFTIVTVIFLPLSSIAGILGMNTADIRDMEQKQWIFWVIAIPVTLLIIFLCLVWAGEFDNFRRWILHPWRRNTEHSFEVSTPMAPLSPRLLSHRPGAGGLTVVREPTWTRERSRSNGQRVHYV